MAGGSQLKERSAALFTCMYTCLNIYFYLLFCVAQQNPAMVCWLPALLPVLGDEVFELLDGRKLFV